MTTQAQVSLADAFRRALRERRAKKIAERLAAKGGEAGRTHLYVSEVGTVRGEAACWRRLWYEVHGAPQDPLTDDALLNFEIGDRVGWMAANLLAEAGVVEKVELPLSFGDIPLSGRLDILLSRDRKVVEVKSTTLKQRSYLPKKDHLAQCLLYIHAVRQIPEYSDVSGGIVAYFCKDAAKGQPVLLEFPVEYDPAEAGKILYDFVIAWRVANRPQLPQRPRGYTPSKFPCAYCVYRTHCWSGLDSQQAQDVPF